MTPIPQQGRAPTVPTTPVTVALPLSLCILTSHCGVLPHSRKGMGEVNQHHYLRSFPTVDRMCSSADDPTPATPTGLGNPLQEQPYCQPSPKDEMDQLQQGQDCGFTLQQKKSTHVNTCPPLEAIKGEPGLTTKGRGQKVHAHNTLSQSSNPHSVHHQAETWDLALSRNLLVPPTTSTFGCKVIQNLRSHWT